jgi:hypothetical protein
MKTAAVTETAIVLNPLSTAISNGIVRSINKVIDGMSAKKAGRTKAISDLAHSLKQEYPYESLDYVHHLASQMYKESVK